MSVYICYAGTIYFFFIPPLAYFFILDPLPQWCSLVYGGYLVQE
jgi:hypothetical protein